MRLLRTVTLGYASVLVPTLAASLAAIWVELRRIGDALDEVHDALRDVDTKSEPFSEHLQGVQATVTGSAEELSVAARSLERANERLS